jgi:hypothetical protein
MANRIAARQLRVLESCDRANREQVKLNARGVHYSEKKEEAYFTATFTLPRVGEVSATYIADRYVALTWAGQEKPRERWTDWRIIRQDSIAGVGPKTADKVRALVEPVITAWLASEAYATARQTAVAHYVIRTLQDGRYGLAPGKRALDAYRAELSFYDHTRIASAVDHLEAARTLLEDARDGE